MPQQSETPNLQLERSQKLAKLFYLFMVIDIIAAVIGIAFVLLYKR